MDGALKWTTFGTHPANLRLCVDDRAAKIGSVVCTTVDERYSA